MAERVHPAGSPSQTTKTNAGDAKVEAESSPAQPKPGTYVIQIPKDQIYRVPPPENAHLFETYSRRASRRRRASPCCRCLAWTLCSLLALLLAVVVTAAILYFVFQPKLPSYSLDKIAVGRFSASKPSTLSPQFNVTVRADNPNKKIGIYYREGSDVIVSYSGVALARGAWPVFYQGHRNVTVFETELEGSGIRLSGLLQSGLADQQRRGAVPLEVDVKVPVRVKFGAVTSWTITVKAKCDVVVDTLMASSKIVSKSCSTKLAL